jgi:dihydroorotase
MSLVIRGGRVIDPGAGIYEVCDVVIADGKIDRIIPSGASVPNGTHIVEAAGHLVTPGLIDIHTHIYRGGSPIGLDYTEHSLRDGVSLVVDGGSAGAYTVGGLLNSVIDPSEGRALAFVNLSSIGIIHYALGELRDPKYIDLDSLEQVLSARPDVLLGIKIRLSHGVFAGDVALARAAFRAALEITKRTGTRVMIHVVAPILPLTEVLDALRPGDIVTHAFHGAGQGTILDTEDNFQSAVAAQQRGVILDIGCGHSGLSFDVLRRAGARGLLPDTISTDLTEQSADGPVFSLTVTMSKALAAGVPLESVIAGVTNQAAKAIGRYPEYGTLLPGSRADVTVLAEVAGAVRYQNRTSAGPIDVAQANVRLEPVLGIRDGLPHVLTGTLRLQPPGTPESE